MNQHSSFSHLLTLAGFAFGTLVFAGCNKLPVANVQQKVEEKVTQEAQKVGAKLLTEQDLSYIKDPLVRKFMIAQSKQTAFRIKTASSGKGEGSNVVEIQMDGEAIAMHSYEELNTKRVREMIIMGDTTYIKDQKDGSWWKQTSKPSPQGSPQPFQEGLSKPDFREYIKNQSTVEYKQVGTESCGASASALTCYKYQEVNSGGKEAARYFWFDNNDYLLRKDTNTFGEFTTTSEYTYDNVSVRAPSPTKDVPEGKSIYLYLTDMGDAEGSKGKLPSQEEIQKMIDNAKNTQQGE